MRSRGFHLVELLVVMTISAILIAAAVPAFQWTIARNRIADATNRCSRISNMRAWKRRGAKTPLRCAVL